MDPRAKALSALARFQVTEASVGETLFRVAEITLDAMPAAAIVGMTMLGDDEQATTAVYTADDPPEIDAAQYREGKGPCLDAASKVARRRRRRRRRRRASPSSSTWSSTPPMTALASPPSER